MQITTSTGKTFILYDNDIVTLDLFSSLFTTDGELKGSYSYSGKAPLLPNKQIIDHADILEKDTSGVLKRLNVRLGNIYWTDVNMNFQVNDDSEIEFNITLKLSFINDTIKSTKLPDIPFPYYRIGGTVEEVETNMKVASQGDFSVYPFVFAPVYNSVFSGSVDEDLSPAITAPNNGVDPAINSIRAEEGEIQFNAPNRTYEVEGSDMPEIRHLAVPFFSLAYVLKEIVKWLGFIPNGAVLVDPDINKMVVYNLNTAQMSTRGFSWVPEAQQSDMYVSAKDHLPDISVSDFLKLLSAYLGIYPVINLPINELAFEFKRDIARFKSLDWSKKQINFNEIIGSEYGGYKISFENEEVDAWVEGENDDVVKTGIAENPVSLKSAVLKNSMSSFGTYLFNIPSDNREGNLLDPNYRRLANFTSVEDKKDFPLMLLFYNGYVSNSTGIAYPKLSGTNEENNNTLFISGNQGVYETYLKSFMIRTSGAKTLKVDLALNPLDLVSWKDNSLLILRSKTGAYVRALATKLSCDVQNGSNIIFTTAETIVLDSTVYKPLAKDKPFVRMSITNLQTEIIDHIESKTYGDITLNLYADRACTIDYSPDLLIYDTILLSRLTNYKSADNRHFDNTITVNRESLRIVFTSNSVTLIHFMLTHRYNALPTSGKGYFLERKIRLVDTASLYALN